MNPNQISIRLDEDLIQKLDSEKGQKNRASYVRELIENYNKIQKENNESQMKFNELQMKFIELQTELAEKDKIAAQKSESNNSLIQALQDDIKYLRSKLDDLTKLLHQEQSLHLQTQRLLPESAKTELHKAWWQFWKH